MASENFPAVMAEVFRHEVGFSDTPKDPGNWTGGKVGVGELRGTNMGIAAHAHPREDIRNLTPERAREIYRGQYWAPVHGAALPHGFDLVAMDGAVNSGVSRGARWLQQGVGTAADGKVGPATIEAARRSDETGIARACDARMAFLRGLRTYATFGRGWSRRVASVQAVATRMWLEAHALPESVRGRMDRAAVKAAAEARQAETQGAKGAAGTSGAGAVAAGGGNEAGLPLEVLIAVAVAAAVVAGVLIWRARRKAAFKRDVAEALTRETRHAA